MKYMNIGHSDVKASIITLGAWSIGGGSWWKNTEDELSIKTIHRALELGINTIDTAPIYGLGHSEEIVGMPYHAHLKTEKVSRKQILFLVLHSVKPESLQKSILQKE